MKARLFCGYPMQPTWYYAEKGEKIGPVNQSDFERLVLDGMIAPETLVWRAGMAEWRPFHTVGIDPNATPVETSYCYECGRLEAVPDMLVFGDRLICAGCKESFAQRLRETGRIDTGRQYTSFWVRVGARIIDSIILVIAYLPISFLASGALIGASATGETPQFGLFLAIQLGLMIIQIGGNALYEVFFLARYSATPGKMLVHAKVIQADGQKLTWQKALGRHFATYISGFALGIGYLMAAFDDERRTLHDRICDTRVVSQ